MAAVVPPVFQARLEEIVNSQKQRMQLLQTETEICIGKRQELREQQSKERHFRQLSFKIYVEAEDISWKIKALEDQRAAANLAATDLEFKLRSSHVEVLELEIERNRNRKFYECERAQLHDFTLQLRNRALNIHTKTTEAVADADEPGDALKCDSQKVRQLAAASCEVDKAIEVNEIERSRLMSTKMAISRDIRSHLDAVSMFEQRLQEGLRDSGKKRRELAAAVETLRAEIKVLQIAERKSEDEVLKSISRRDKRKRELLDLKCSLARKKRSFFNCKEPHEDVGENSSTL